MIENIIFICFEFLNNLGTEILFLDKEELFEELALFGRKVIFIGSLTLVVFCLLCLIEGYPDPEEEEKKKKEKKKKGELEQEIPYKS